MDKPIENKKIYLTKTFTEAYDANNLTNKHCKLLVKFGNGSFTEKIEEADFCIVGSAPEDDEEDSEFATAIAEEKEKIVQDYPYLLAFEWAEFVDLIYPLYLEQALRKMEK